MSKKKIDLLVDQLIMPLPWINQEVKKIPIAKVPIQESLPQPKVEKKVYIVEPVVKKTEITPKKVSLSSFGNKLNTGGISIKKTLKEQEENQPTELINTAATPFTIDDLMPLWQTQADKAKELGKKSYHASLTKSQPVVKEDYTIELTVYNRVQEETILKEKPELLEFLKEKLNNYSIQLNTYVVEQKEEVHLYTDRDKFKELVKKYPDLLYLKEKLNLDFEF